jgi:predicted Zn-dependent protease
MRLAPADVRRIAERAVHVTPADAAEAVVISEDAALTRFAGNGIHQNVAESDTTLTIRAVLGKRTGVATTNRLDDDALARCAAAAVEAARHAPADPDFPGLPGPEPVAPAPPVTATVGTFDAEARAAVARSVIAPSERRGFTAAGTVSVADYAVAVANSNGVSVAAEASDIRATVLSMAPHRSSGWASYLGRDEAGVDGGALGEQAADIAERSSDPVPLDPGTYTVVLAPEAVAEALDFVGYLGFGAKAYAEQSSFLSRALGTQVADTRVGLADDVSAPGMIGLPFDFEGQPKLTTPLIEGGVARGPVTDSYYAHKLGLPNTGHALPAPNSWGPLPLNLVMAAGDADLDDMIASVEHGVYVTRFHYVNVEDPMKLVLTGMTRDGTFLIERGRLTRPVRNLRFTQSMLDALEHVGAIGRERRLVGPGEGGATLVPALLIERWEFTGQTG